VKPPPKNASLPDLPEKKKVRQISLYTEESKSATPVFEGKQGSLESKVATVYDKQLLAICFTNAPLLKTIPKREAALFAREWSSLLNECLVKKDSTSWVDFFRFPKCILLAPVRGGRRISRSKTMADLVNERIKKWAEGREALWQDVISRSQRAAKVSSPTPDLEKSVISALRQGDVRKALQLFVAAPIAPKCDATFAALKALHPAADSAVEPPSAPLHKAPNFTDDRIREALNSFAPTSAAGLFGYKPSLLQQCARANSVYFVSTLRRAVNELASGDAPLFLQPFLAGGVSIALQKNATAVRPLCCGDPIRRLVAKCFCLGGKDEIAAAFEGKNFGVGCKGGVEVVAHSLRSVLIERKHSDLALLKIDFKNAFNLMDRNAFVKASAEMFPGLERRTRWCYTQSPLLIYDHSSIFESRCGVQQGDPLGPLYFCCGLQAIVDRIAALEPVYNKWYMDDGGIIGSPELLLKVWEILKTDGPPIGLQLNPTKCEWSWLNAECNLPCPLEQVDLVPTGEIQMLGVPLGETNFVTKFVSDRLMTRSTKVMAKLMQFEDPQAAMYLVRLSYGIVRANHFMRTTPLAQWEEIATQFDTQVRDTVAHILGINFPGDSYLQACVSTKIGGLGIRRTVDHATPAYYASMFEARVTCNEKWALPFPMSEYRTQHRASSEIDAKTWETMIARASPRDAQRLRRLDMPHANAWLSVLPSAVDGNKEFIMTPSIYITAVRRLLGLSVIPEPTACPLCTQIMDLYGDHALCCKKSSDLITRHNRIRNLVAHYGEKGLLTPELEKLGLLGHDDRTRRRPGDVSFKSWSLHKGLAIDVAVICPVAASHIHEEEPCELYAVHHKHALYDDGFKGSNYDFAAMVFETSGGVNSEGEAVFKQILRCASRQSNVSHSFYAGRAWARLSCCLQTSVAQMILNRRVDECVSLGVGVGVGAGV